jgi:hypothetical protein
MKRALALVLLVTTLAAVPRSARARRLTAKFLLDGGIGVTFPIGDYYYRNAYFPSPEFMLRFGAELWFSRHFGLAPEAGIEIVPVVSNSPGNRGQVDFTRLRWLFGLRLLFGFGRGHAFFLRAAFGADVEFFEVPTGFGGPRPNFAWFVFEPGLGLQFKVARRMVAGFAVDFPIVPHDYNYYGYSNVQVDTSLLFFLGLRVP